MILPWKGLSASGQGTAKATGAKMGLLLMALKRINSAYVHAGTGGHGPVTGPPEERPALLLVKDPGPSP